jgi:aminomethyltransferase
VDTSTPAPFETGALPEEVLKRTALIGVHRALGAKLVGFGGWEMPLAYADGTIAEHRACRQDAVAFDVSHLGTVRVEGADALDRLQAALTNDLRKVAPGRAQYTHLLDETDASVVDDIIVWWVADGVFDVMPNASNTDRVLDAIGGTDTTAERSIIAVQGPHARMRASAVLPEAAAVPRFGVERFEWRGAACVAAGTGYTGEDGFEVAVPNDLAAAMWEAVVGTGVALPLHGHELGPGITSLQAGLGWVVGWDKGDFRGRAALAAERDRGVARRLVGLTTEGRQPPREGATVVVDGTLVGTVTSGNFSPMLEHGIALALVDSVVDATPGRAVDLEQRGKVRAATMATTPFTKAGQWATSP